MNRFFVLIALSIVALLPQSASGQLDSLFNGDKPSADIAAADDEIITANVVDLVSEFNVVEEDAPSFAKLEVEYEGITYPVYVYLTDSKKMLWIKIGLDDVPENAGDHVDKLLNLMELSGTFGPQFYSFETESRLISLYSCIRPEHLQKELLTERINVMVYQATEQSEAWDTDYWTAEKHVGSWTAQVAEGTTMAINLRADGTFDLTNTAPAGVTSINGNYMFEGEVLKMKDTDGNEVSGPLRFTDGNHFDLSINGQNMSFERG